MQVSSACSCLNYACNTPLPASQSLGHDLLCNADNCLRAFERGNGQAFCSAFTQSVVTDTAGLPSSTTQCTGSTIARVSSACSCLNRNSGSATSGKKPTSLKRLLQCEPSLCSTSFYHADSGVHIISVGQCCLIDCGNQFTHFDIFRRSAAKFLWKSSPTCFTCQQFTSKLGYLNCGVEFQWHIDKSYSPNCSSHQYWN